MIQLTKKRSVSLRPVLPLFFALAPLMAARDMAHAAATPANATAPIAERIELRSKWTAGQQLTYDVRLDGTASLLASPNTPSPLAGLPLDVEMSLAGQTVLDTLRVDELGVGTIAVRVPSIKLNAQTFGQKFDWSVQNGRSNLTLNGQRLGGQGGQDALARSLVEPQYALEISTLGRIQNAVPIGVKTVVDAPEANGDAAVQKAPAAPGMGLPFNPSAMLQSVFWRAVPALLPSTSVVAGEKWTADISWPPPVIDLPGVAVDRKSVAPTPIGKVDFTLRGTEQIAGRKVLRIGVAGAFDIDEAKAKALRQSTEALQNSTDAAAVTPAAPKAPAAKPAQGGAFRQQLNRSSQKIGGDLWFDAAAGQLVRAELSLETRVATRDVAVEAKNGAATKPGAKAAKPGDSWVDFTGTMQVQLKGVTQKPIEGIAKLPPQTG